MAPAELGFYRYGISGLFFYIVIHIQGKKINIAKKDLLRMSWVSLIGISLYTWLALYALTYISASLCGVLNGMIPLLTIFGERFFRNKPLNGKVMIGLSLSLFGIVLMSQSGSNAGSSPLLGAFLVLLSLLMWVFFTFKNEVFFETYSEIEILCVQSIMGAFFMIPVVFRTSPDIIRQFTYFTNPDLVKYLMILSVLITGGGYLCYMYGVKHLGVRFMSFVMNLLPVVAMISAFFLLGETISLIDIVGVTLVIASVYIVKSKPKSLKDGQTAEKNYA